MTPLLDEIAIPVGDEVFTGLAAGPESGGLVLLLHGFPQTAWMWRHQLLALADAGYRAVAPDQRGYSPGARPADDDRYRLSHLVADVLAIADDIGGHTFHLVGHDWGGAVAWQLAGRYPQRLRSLTSLSVPHPAAFGRAMAGERGSDQAQRSSYIDVFRRDGQADVMLADDAQVLRVMLLASGLTEPEIGPYLDRMREPGALRAALAWYRATSLTEVEGLGPITTPTLYLWGTDDPALGRVAAELTAEHVEGPYRFEALDGVGHWVAEQAPEVTSRMLLEHLASHRGSAGA